MSRQKTLAEFGLQRGTRQNFMTPSFAFLEGKANPVNMARNGQSFFTEEAGSDNTAFSDFSFTYVMNVSEKTLVVFAAFLEHEVTKVRYTEMRAWQIIVDSWLTGGGNQPAGTPEGLQCLAFHDVIEDVSRAAMRLEMSTQWDAGTAVRTRPPTSVEFTSDSPQWMSNPWIRCCQRVSGAMSTPSQQITASRAWSIFAGQDDYHLVVELTSTRLTAAPTSSSSGVDLVNDM